MAKRKVGRPKQSNNNMGAQSGANLTGVTMSSQSCELKTSSVEDHDATTTPPTVGDGSKTRAQESPSTSDVKLEYDIVPPDKGKGKAVPDNTAQGGSGHDPPREWERMSHLSRRNESDDRSQSHSIHCHPTRRLDNEDTWDELASEVKRVVESSAKAVAKAMRNMEERHAEMQASLSSLNQCINALRKKYQEQEETSHSWDSRLQTHHTRNDELGLNPQRDSRPTKERHIEGGPLCRPPNEPNDRSQRLSPQNSQRDLDEETPVDAVARSWREAECLEQSENDTAKRHRKALDHMIQAAEEVVEHAKRNNLSRQEVIDAENELARAVQAKNSWYQVQKAGLNVEAHSIKWWTKEIHEWTWNTRPPTITDGL